MCSGPSLARGALVRDKLTSIVQWHGGEQVNGSADYTGKHQRTSATARGPSYPFSLGPPPCFQGGSREHWKLLLILGGSCGFVTCAGLYLHKHKVLREIVGACCLLKKNPSCREFLQ